MLVDDKLAKEKLINAVVEHCQFLSCTNNEHQIPELIRNTDLTDCQPQTDDGSKWCNYCSKDNHNDSECWSTRPANWKPSEGLVNVFGNPIAPAPDQGSVRNATDMREKRIEVVARALCKYEYPTRTDKSYRPWEAEASIAVDALDKFDAAIRALPDQKD